MCLFSLSCFNCIRLAIYKQASLKSNEYVKSINTSGRGGRASLLLDMISNEGECGVMLGGVRCGGRASVMQGSSVSFDAEGWLLLICCGSVIYRWKQTPRTVVCDLSQPYNPLPNILALHCGTSALQATEVPRRLEKPCKV